MQTMDMQPLKVAVVGLGWVSTNRHIPVMKRNPGFDIVGVVDRRPGRAADQAQALGVRRHAETGFLDTIPWLDEVDAVTIGTAPHSHFDLARQALLCSKHVLVEKPFAMAPEEGRTLQKLAQHNGRVLAVVHNFQFATSFGKLIRDVEGGRLGSVASVAVRQLGNPGRRLPEWYESLPLGLYYDESPHFFYLIRRLCKGTPRLLDAAMVKSTKGLATPAMLDIHYLAEGSQGRFPVSVNLNFEAPLSEWFVSVLGDKGMGIVDIFRDIYIFLPNDGRHTTKSVITTSLAATGQHWGQYFTSGVKHLLGCLFFGNEEVFERFLAATRGGAGPEGIGSEEAQAVLEMQHEVIGACRVLA